MKASNTKEMYHLLQSMRWYGPGDPVRLADIRQAGAVNVVTALHDVPIGDVWTTQAIEERKRIIHSAGLSWTVVESLPVHEDIKTRQRQYKRYTENYKESLQNLAAAGIEVVTYNFMPILDWLRTDVHYTFDNGAEGLRFDHDEYAIFDLFILRRTGARKEYADEAYKRLAARYSAMTPDVRRRIEHNMMLGLPGSKVAFTRDGILERLSTYAAIGGGELKNNLFSFLHDILPVADQCGIRMAIHPDDPPYPVLGLPRVMSTAEDVSDLLAACPSPANGLCFCTGSFGARPDNDLVSMIRTWGAHIFFLHLRNTSRDPVTGDFYEANHLDGDADMYAIMQVIVDLMHAEQRSIPMRPDHGHRMLGDLKVDTYPGYSAIGRLKGLAELRGLEYAIQRSFTSNK